MVCYPKYSRHESTVRAHRVPRRSTLRQAVQQFFFKCRFGRNEKKCGGICSRPLSMRLAQHGVGEMPAARGSSRVVNPVTGSKMGRRRTRALDAAVEDLIRQSESLSTTADGSFGSTTQGHGGEFCPVVMHRPPYMDVQTVKTNLTADQAAKLEVKSRAVMMEV